MSKFLNFLCNVVMFCMIAVTATAACGIPLWLFLLTKHMLNPVGFWQNLVMYGLGFYLLVGIQLLLFVVWIATLILSIKVFFLDKY